MPTQLAQAIARFEGWLVPGSIAQRRNNPGNLTDFYTGQIQTFGTPEEGWAALEAHIARHQGLTLEQYIAGGGGYAGYDPGNVGYASRLASWLGIGVDQTVASIIGQNVIGAYSPVLDWDIGAMPAQGDNTLLYVVLAGVGVLALVWAMS